MYKRQVRGLFIGALWLRRICLAAAAISVALLFLLKADVRRLLPRALMAGTGLFFLITAGLAALISTDFTKYFVIFHHIFFDNDLWLLDARTDPVSYTHLDVYKRQAHGCPCVKYSVLMDGYI